MNYKQHKTATMAFEFWYDIINTQGREIKNSRSLTNVVFSVFDIKENSISLTWKDWSKERAEMIWEANLKAESESLYGFHLVDEEEAIIECIKRSLPAYVTIKDLDTILTFDVSQGVLNMTVMAAKMEIVNEWSYAQYFFTNYQSFLVSEAGLKPGSIAFMFGKLYINKEKYNLRHKA